MIVAERPKGMRRSEWEQVQAQAALAAMPQHFIIWFYRGQALQWVRSPDYRAGFMKGCQDITQDLPLTVWHAALVDAMHWAYDHTQHPPKGWLRATADDLLNIDHDDD